MNPRVRLAAIEAELRSLHEIIGVDAVPTEEQQTAWDALVEERGVASGEGRAATGLMLAIERDDARRALVLDLATRSNGHVEPGDNSPRPGSPEFMRKVEPFDGTPVRSLTRGDRRSRALAVIEREKDVEFSDDNRARVERMVRRAPEEDNGHTNFDGDVLAERLLLTENEHYRSAFMIYLRHGDKAGMMMSADQQRAVADFMRHEARAANEGTGSAGGFGVPVIIDPTIILTSGAADVPILRAARVEPITNNTWKGVSSQGMSWAFAQEGAAAGDNTPILAQPVVNAFRAQGFIPYSIEIGMDYPNFANEMSTLIDAGYMDLLAVKTISGSGTNEMRGIFTALDANTNAEVRLTTAGTFDGQQVFRVWNALLERYRTRASWLQSVGVESAIRQFAAQAGSSSAYFTIDLTQEGITNINGRPAMRTDYAPPALATTGTANVLVVGDFKNYLIAQRLGMTIEQIPMLFDVTFNRPTGQRGWYGVARVGGDSINDSGFKLLNQS